MQYLTWAYVILIYAFLPLFMRQDYYELGEAKGLAYLFISGGAAILMLIAMAVKGDLKKLFSKKEPDIRTYAVAVFLLPGILTFLSATDKEVSLVGLPGWRTGFITILLMVFFMAVSARYIRAEGYMLVAMLITPFFEFVMGILNSFSVRPLDLYGANGSFLATIGNVNWYAGFLSIFVPMGVGLLSAQKRFSFKFYLCLAYVCLGVMALLTQGSDSAVLVIAGTYAALLVFCLRDRDSFRGFLVQLTVLGIVMELCRVLTTVFDGRYGYDDSLAVRLCDMRIGMILVALALLLYRLSRLFEEIKMPWKEKTYGIMAAVIMAAGAIAGVVYLMLNFDLSYGNSRGVIWSISLDMFNGLSPWRKMVGVGQDCFYQYAYSDPVTAESLLNIFNGNRLTNAHCELLTILIERGILGVVSYLFLFGVALLHFRQNKRERNILLFALPVIAYFCYGLVSFSQIMSTPYFFMMLGMGMSLSSS